ncbi:MFS transporter [Mycobacterium shinjukuense]|uniref:MFS transporter n=1 Tax=Mycobacterium shinjukuense TaxID=398694 RepID=A0A7I7MXD7_9MYCO|nr:MFS transporter [Mycobacterium shinjukuense]
MSAVTTLAAISVENRPTNDRVIARYPAAIWLLLGGNLLVRSAGFAYPFMAYHVTARGHAAGAVGVVLAAYGVGWTVGQLTCGWLVDRVGARVTLVVSMSVAAAVLALMAGAHSVPALLVGATVAGLVCDAPRPVLAAVIAELIPEPQRRARLDAWRHGWVLNIGAAITGGVGILVGGRLGTPALYGINAVACATLAVVAARYLPAELRRPAPAATEAGFGSETSKNSYRQAFSDKRLVLLFASGLATLTALMGIFAAVPMLMSACGLGAAAYGWVQLINALAVVAVTPLITPWLSKRLAGGARLDILAGAGAWMTACMAAAGLAHTTLSFTAAAAACAPGEVAWFVVAAGIVHRIAPLANKGRYHGIWSMTTAAASVIAPILASASLAHGGRPSVAAATATVGLLGTALCLPLARVLSCANQIPTMRERPAV